MGVGSPSAAGAADPRVGLRREMPIEIRRFGVGHRRPDGPPGTTGVTGQIIHADGRGIVTELAFSRGARIEPHANPNTNWLIVIEGGGWVGVGEERTRIAAGEAVHWPADVTHAAWTEHSEMRAIVVELAGADDGLVRGVVDGRAHELAAGDPEGAGVGTDDRSVSRGDGGLWEGSAGSARLDPDAGEPA